jgi:hypothetical protein
MGARRGRFGAAGSSHPAARRVFEIYLHGVEISAEPTMSSRATFRRIFLGASVTMKPFEIRNVSAGIVCAALSLCLASSVRAMDERTDLLEFKSENFSHPATIDNKWMPLKPGTQWVYSGWKIDEEDRRVPYQLIVSVTDLLKDVNDIETVVVLEQYFTNRKLEVSGLSFRAQDSEGNVWLLGEAKEFYDENVKLIGARMWAAGLQGSRAGIIMPAKPAAGMPSYSHGHVESPYSWDDRGQVRETGARVKVPAGTFEHVVVTEEGGRGGRHAPPIQVKYLAPGVGSVKVNWVGRDPAKEGLELSKIVHLGAQQMEKVNSEAVNIEERSSFYGLTTEPPRRAQ